MIQQWTKLYKNRKYLLLFVKHLSSDYRSNCRANLLIRRSCQSVNASHPISYNLTPPTPQLTNLSAYTYIPTYLLTLSRTLTTLGLTICSHVPNTTLNVKYSEVRDSTFLPTVHTAPFPMNMFLTVVDSWRFRSYSAAVNIVGTC